MKKSEKMLKRSLIGLVGILALSATTVGASSVTINDAVPTMQGYKQLKEGTKTYGNNFATVILTKLDPDAVTFTVRAKKSDGSWGSYYSDGYGTVTKTNKQEVVIYEYSLIKGTTTQARFRNSNFSLNSNQIEGTFKY